MTNYKDINIENKPFLNDEINLKFFFNFIYRNKFLIGGFSILFFIIFCLYSLSLKKIWKGEFEIVLGAKNNSDSAIGNLSKLNNNLLGLKTNNKSSLETEVEILKSPYVLMPIFDYVNKEIKKINPKSEDLIFINWKKNNLKIGLKDDTSVLSISYIDSNKELIIPVLNKISNSYQEYSGKAKRRSIELSKNYIISQISLYKKKSSDSFKKAQEYGINEDLTILDSELSKPNLDNKIKYKSNALSNLNVERIRVESANKIRNIDLEINKIQGLKKGSDQIEYLSYITPEIVKGGLKDLLRQINLQLIDAKLKYQEDSRKIKFLEAQKSLVSEKLKDKAIGYLKTQRIAAEAKLEASSRPKEVLLTYKELIREAGRDENNLIRLEEFFDQINLEESKIEDPWKLITYPTLRKFPIAPVKKTYGLFGLLIGFLFGSFFAFYKEKKSGYIYEKDEIKRFIGLPITKEIYIKGDVIEESPYELNFNQIIPKKDKKINLIITNNLRNYEKKIINYLKKHIDINGINISINNEITEPFEKESHLLIISLKQLELLEIVNLKKKLDRFDIKLSGVVFVDLKKID